MRHPGRMPCSKRKTDLLGRSIGTLPNHCTLLFVIIFIALKVHRLRIGLLINATCVSGSIELRQFGFLLLWFVIFQPRKIKAFGYRLFLIKNTPKYKLKPMPPLKIYWLECSVHIIFSQYRSCLRQWEPRVETVAAQRSSTLLVREMFRRHRLHEWVFWVRRNGRHHHPSVHCGQAFFVLIQWQVPAPGNSFSDFPLFS